MDLILTYKFNYESLRFVQSFSNSAHLPTNAKIEIAIAGYSNSGKSTLLNTLANNKNLAKSSNTPGRTQLLNLFAVSNETIFIDLPGYGYAKASGNSKNKITQLLNNYFNKRKSLKKILLIADIRHALKDLDIELLKFTNSKKISIIVLLNKCDKLSKEKSNTYYNKVSLIINKINPDAEVILFSNTKKTGLMLLKNKLSEFIDKNQLIIDKL